MFKQIVTQIFANENNSNEVRASFESTMSFFGWKSFDLSEINEISFDTMMEVLYS